MCPTDVPLFIVYSYSSVIILGLVVAISILFKNKEHSVNRNAFYFMLAIVLWTLGDLVQWETTSPLVSYVFSRLSYLADFIFLFILYFAYDFVGEKLIWKKKLIFALPLFLTVFAVAGGFGVGTYDSSTCITNVGWYIFPSLIFNVGYAIWASCILLKGYRNTLVRYSNKSQIRLLVFAIMFSVLWSVAYEIIDVLNVVTDIGIEISPYFILGNLIFIVLIAFNIIEYDLFDFGVLPRKWFSFSIVSLIFIGMFFLALTPIFYFISLLFYIGIIWLFWGK
jgi:hypothetical protein